MTAFGPAFIMPRIQIEIRPFSFEKSGPRLVNWLAVSIGDHLDARLGRPSRRPPRRTASRNRPCRSSCTLPRDVEVEIASPRRSRTSCGPPSRRADRPPSGSVTTFQPPSLNAGGVNQFFITCFDAGLEPEAELPALGTEPQAFFGAVGC